MTGHCNSSLSLAPTLSLPLPCCLSPRGADMAGDPAQQHRADQGQRVLREEPPLCLFRLLFRREAAHGHHWPIGTLRAGAFLSLQEVPPPQHTRSDLFNQPHQAQTRRPHYHLCSSECFFLLLLHNLHTLDFISELYTLHRRHCF